MKSEDFGLANGKIIEFEIPSIMERGHEQKASIKVRGNGKYIFWTLLLVNPLNKQQWWPDNNSIDLVRNGGKIDLKDEVVLESTWYFPIFEDAALGEYTAFLGIYQDTYDLPTFNRRLLDYKIKKIRVVKGAQEVLPKEEGTQINVNVAGTKSENEYFEILRNRIVWCICHNLISKNVRKFHGADMISDCAGAFLNEAALTEYKLTGQHEFYKPALEKVYKPLVEGGFIVEQENNTFIIPEGSKLENICKNQLSDGRGYINWNEIDWG